MNVLIKEIQIYKSEHFKFPPRTVKKDFAQKQLYYPVVHWTKSPPHFTERKNGVKRKTYLILENCLRRKNSASKSSQKKGKTQCKTKPAH